MFSQQPASPPTGYNSNSAYPERMNSHRFFSKLTNYSNSLSSSSLTHQTIQAFCTQDFDWSTLLDLIDRISNHPNDSKQAVKSLKKLIKQQHTQIRAIRITVIFLLNSADPLRLLLFKKLFQVLKELYQKSTKHNQPLKEIILKSFSVLAYEFQNHKELHPFTDYYNHIKPNHAPLNGTPLIESDGFFAPQHSPQISEQQQQQQSYAQLNQDGLRETFPVMRDVRAEAELARSNARLLIEALAFTPPIEMDANPIIQEFHSKCLYSQNQLMDDIRWATEQAAQARTYSQHDQVIGPPTEEQSRTNPPEERDGESSREEQLLSSLLSANSELVDAFRQHDELERLARNEREMREVEERSRIETRIDRHSTGLLGLDVPHASGSSSNASPRPSLDRPPSPHQLASNSIGLQQQYNPRTIVDEDSSRLSNDDKYYSKPQITSSSPLQHASSSPTQEPSFHLDHSSEPQDQDGLVITPLERSEKSLGKMRRISGRSSLTPLALVDHLSVDHHPPSNSHSNHLV